MMKKPLRFRMLFGAHYSAQKSFFKPFQKYVLAVFLLLSWAGVFGQGSETFTNLGTIAAYGSGSWTGDNGGTWNTTSARTDQTLTFKAICTNNSGTVTSPTYGNGMGTLQFNYVRGFTGTGARFIDIYVNNVKIGNTVVVDTNSNTVQNYSSVINISGNVKLELRTSMNQIIIDDISWTAYSVPVNPVLAISGTLAHGSVCPLTAATTQAYTINNSGSTAASGVTITSDNPEFVVTGVPTSVPGNGSATYSVTFTPSSAGAKTATIIVASTTSGSNSPTSSLTGSGTISAAGTVTTSTAGTITAKSSVLNGNVTNIGACPVISERGFVYSVTATNATPTNAGTGVTKVPVAGITTGTITNTPTTLLSSTQYSYRAYVLNGSTYAYGSVSNFTTLPALSISGTLAHGSICPNVAAISQTNTITNNGNSTITGITVNSNNPEFAVSGLSTNSVAPGATATYVVTFTPTSAGPKTVIITIASPEATVTSNLTGTGATSVSPVSVTQAPSNLLATSVTLRATSGTTFGTCPNTTEKGFVYSVVNTTPTVADIKISVTPLGTTGLYTFNLSGLSEGTTYYYRAYLFDGTTYTYGGVQNFQTTVTLPNNVTGTSACMQDDTAVISWTASSNATGYLVFAVASSTIGAVTPTSGITDYNNADANFSSVTNNSTPASLGKLLYNGTGTSFAVTGLTENTAYSFRVIAYRAGAELRNFANGTTAGSKFEKALAQDDVKTFVGTSANNQVTLNWTNYLPTNCFDEVLIVANQGTVVFTPTGNGSLYTANPIYSASNQVVYKGTANSKAITGLTNGLPYCFKIFVRRGTTWSDGTDVCVVPDVAYCAASGDMTYSTGITNVQFNTINQPSGKSFGYSDYTAISTTVSLGGNYPLTVQANTAGNYTVYSKVWFDWNHNGSFNDFGEEYDLGTAVNTANGATTNSPLNIVVPHNAAVGNTRMRASVKYDTYATSCENTYDGEVEDYTINVIQPVTPEINVKGLSINIPSGFDEPNGLNNTRFAATDLNTDSAIKDFVIENVGASTLNLSGSPAIAILGASPGDFIVTQQAPTTVSSGANVTFKIKFRPTVAGLRTAIVSVANNDPDENPYTFAIEGNGKCISNPILNVFPTSGPANTVVEFNSTVNDLSGATVTFNDIPVPVLFSSSTNVEVAVPASANDGIFVVQLANGCTFTQNFDVFDTDVSNCESSTGTNSTNLIIYEVYDENGGSGGVVTLFNGTGAAVDLSTYNIQRAPDYGGTYSVYANLTGTVANGAVAIIGVSPSLCGYTPTGNGGFGSGFNDNDGIRLRKGTTVIDDVKAPNRVGYYMKRKLTSLTPAATFISNQWIIQSISSGQCLTGVGNSPVIKTAPVLTLSPQYVINCGITGVSLTGGGTEGVSGGLPLNYQWYSLGTSGNWTALSNGEIYSGSTSQTLSISDITGLDDYQYYCQIRENTATCYTATNSTQIRIGEKTWNGFGWLGRNNISTTAPTVLDKIKLNADYITQTNGNLNGCSMINNSPFQLTISANTYANIEGNITNNGTMLIESDGNLIQKNDLGTFTGSPVTAKRNLNLTSTREQYNYLISPLEGYGMKDIYKDNNGLAIPVPFVLYHSEATNKFYTSSGAYIKGRGLAVKEPAVGTITSGATFVGKPTNGAFTFDIVNGNTADPKRGYNLVGNPYPSNMDLIAFYINNGGESGDLSSTFYFWDNKANNQTTQQGSSYGGQAYATFNVDSPPTSGTGTFATGDTAALQGTNKPTRYVKTGQGFMVRSTAPSMTLHFNNNSRTYLSGANNFFGKTEGKKETPVDRYWLNMIAPGNVASNIAVVYFPEGNNGFSKDDSRSMGGSDALYSFVDNEKVSINGRSNFVDTDVISLGSQHFASGTYTVELEGKEGIFENGQNIYLKDLQTGVLTNLSEGNYTFAASEGESSGRFEIIYKPQTVLGTAITGKENILVYRDGDRFVVKALTKDITLLEVYDVSGRLIFRMQPNSKEAVVDAATINSGLYILKITQFNTVITKKVMK